MRIIKFIEKNKRLISSKSNWKLQPYLIVFGNCNSIVPTHFGCYQKSIKARLPSASPLFLTPFSLSHVFSWWWWNRKTEPSWYSGTSWSRTRAPAVEHHTWTSCVTCTRRSASFSARPTNSHLHLYDPPTRTPTPPVHPSLWKKALYLFFFFKPNKLKLSLLSVSWAPEISW